MYKVSFYVLEKFSVNTEVVFGYSAKTQKDDFQKSFNFSYSLSGKVSF